MPPDESKYFNKKTRKKCTKMLGKVKSFEIQVVFYMLCSINECFFSIYNHISTALLTQ
jgi:hypothetical protein